MPTRNPAGDGNLGATVLYLLAALALVGVILVAARWARGAALTPMKLPSKARRRMVNPWDEAGRRMETPPPEEAPDGEPPEERGDR